MYADEQDTNLVMAKQAHRLGATKRERLIQLKNNLEQSLKRVDSALKVLDENPKIEEFMNKIEAAL